MLVLFCLLWLSWPTLSNACVAERTINSILHRRLRWALLARHIYDRIPLSNSTYIMASHRFCFAYWFVSPLIKDAALGRIQSHFHFPLDWLRPPAIIWLLIKLGARLSETPDHYIKGQFSILSNSPRTYFCHKISKCASFLHWNTLMVIHLLLLSPSPLPPPLSHLPPFLVTWAWGFLSLQGPHRKLVVGHTALRLQPLWRLPCPPWQHFLSFIYTVFFSKLCFFQLKFLQSVSRVYHASFSFSGGVSTMLLQDCTFDFLCSFSKTFPRAKHCERPTSDWILMMRLPVLLPGFILQQRGFIFNDYWIWDHSRILFWWSSCGDA